MVFSKYLLQELPLTGRPYLSLNGLATSESYIFIMHLLYWYGHMEFTCLKRSSCRSVVENQNCDVFSVVFDGFSLDS